MPRVIVQPLTSIDDLRAEILKLGYGLESETLVADAGRLYVTFVFDITAPLRSLDSDEARYVGPDLASGSDPLIGPWLTGLQRWLRSMGTRDVAQPLAERLARRLAAVEAAMARTPEPLSALAPAPVRH